MSVVLIEGAGLVSLSQLQEVPPKNLVLLVGPPGSGKTTFCQQAILQNLAIDRPIIYVTTEYGSFDADRILKEKGLGEVEPCLLHYIDAYNETVGLTVPDRPDTALADCEDLSSIDMAISKSQEGIGKKGVLLVFDSLTSPYLFSGPEVLRFMRRTLSRFASRGNSVLACFDEGSGRDEDLVAMMSLCSGVMKMEVEEEKSVLNVLKHPKVERTRIEVPTDRIWKARALDVKLWDPEKVRHSIEAFQRAEFRELQKQLTVNIFWPNFMQWSGILWDPKRFPVMTYEVWKEYGVMTRELISRLPWHTKLLFKLYYRLPESLSKPRDMKKMVKLWGGLVGEKGYRDCIMEYLDDVSKTDEHHIRLYENVECWGFENIGAPMASMLPPATAGMCKGFEGEERDWNAIETKCIGLGDPYCEWKVVPGEIPELKDSLEKDISVVERIHERLMNRLMGFLLNGKPLIETRPKLGSDFFMGMGNLAVIAGGERYIMALRMGGAKAGKEVGENLMDAGIRKDEVVKRLLRFLEYCRVGKVSIDETIRIEESFESVWAKAYTTEKWEEPLCFFTTGFLNGFFSAVKNQHVKETKCIAMGDPYCEWEFR